MTERKRRNSTLALVLSVLSIASSCNPSIDEPGPQPSAATTASQFASTSSPTPRPTSRAASASASAEDSARQEVLALVVKYYAVDEAIATDRKVPLDRYYEVAGGDYAQALLRGAQAQRAKDYRVQGKVKVGTAHFETLAGPVAGGRPTSATVWLCLDVSGVKVVNQKGESVVEPGRAGAYIERLTLRRLQNGWRVVDGKDKDTSKCVV